MQPESRPGCSGSAPSEASRPAESPELQHAHQLEQKQFDVFGYLPPSCETSPPGRLDFWVVFWLWSSSLFKTSSSMSTPAIVEDYQLSVLAINECHAQFQSAKEYVLEACELQEWSQKVGQYLAEFIQQVDSRQLLRSRALWDHPLRRRFRGEPREATYKRNHRDRRPGHRLESRQLGPHRSRERR